MSIEFSYKTQVEDISWHRRKCAQAVTLLCILLFFGNAFANNTEYKLKAAYLYQFTKFTQWPSRLFNNDETPIQICILGKSPFGDSLDSFTNRTSQHRKLSIRYLSSSQGISDCHVIFISQSEEEKLSQILHRVENSPVLTVSDIKGFAHRGGIIEFVAKHKKLGIEINIDASRISGAKLSSKLLEVATLVQDRLEE